MIKAENIKKIYGDRIVLDIESFTLKKGETVVVAGPNGSGKSTLLKILAGILKKSEGEIRADGRILCLSQQNIPFNMTVRKNIYFSMSDKTDKEKRCDGILTELGLIELAEKNAKGLSGGECQRLALGRLLVNECDFLFLDEPTSAADIESSEIVEKALRKYREETGCGILMTTHSPRQAMKFADRIIMLNKGVIAEQGTPEKLFDSPETEWGKKFINMWKI